MFDFTFVIYLLCFLIALFVICTGRLSRRSSRSVWNGSSLPYLSSSSLERNVPIFAVCYELAKSHGDIFVTEWGHSDVIIVNGSSSVREFLSKGRSVASRPLVHRIQLYNPQFLGLADSPYSSNWKEQRKFCLAKLKSATTNDSFHSVLQNEIKQTLAEFNKTEHLPFDPSKTLQGCVFSVICFTLLGKTFDSNDRSFGRLFNLISDSLELTTTSPLTGKIPWIQRGRQKAEDRKIVQVRQELMEFIQRCVDEEDAGVLQTDFSISRQFSEQMESGSHESFTEEQRIYLLTDLFNGGVETTVLTLQWSLLYMVNNPECQRKMQEELDKAMLKRHFLSFDYCAKLPYCEAVLLEVYRNSSVGPLSLPHLTLEDVTIGGKYKIPAHSTVMTNLWSVHRDSNIWAHPWDFRPENFLDKDLKVINKDALMAFSLGSRRCVGEHLSKVVTFAVFVNIMKHFTLLPPEGVAKLSEEGVFRTTHACKEYQLRAIPRLVTEL